MEHVTVSDLISLQLQLKEGALQYLMNWYSTQMQFQGHIAGKQEF